jgi:hypothetical protein
MSITMGGADPAKGDVTVVKLIDIPCTATAQIGAVPQASGSGTRGASGQSGRSSGQQSGQGQGSGGGGATSGGSGGRSSGGR